MDLMDTYQRSNDVSAFIKVLIFLTIRATTIFSRTPLHKSDFLNFHGFSNLKLRISKNLIYILLGLIKSYFIDSK